MTNTPRNCNECEYTKACMSYYGGNACKHQKEIVKKNKK